MLSVSWSFVDHSVIIQALREGLIEHEASDTGGVPRWKSSCDQRIEDRLTAGIEALPHYHQLLVYSYSRLLQVLCSRGS